MTANDYLRLLEEKYNPKNDSALADLLKIRPTSIHKYKKENRSFSDEVSVTVGKLLNIDPMRIITDMDAHRALTPTSKKYRLKIAKLISTVGIVLSINCILCKKVQEWKNVNLLNNYKLIY